MNSLNLLAEISWRPHRDGQVRQIMKTVVSFVILCGALMGLAPFPLEGQTPEPASPAPQGADSNQDVVRSARLSAGLDDIVKLAKAKVEESIILAFVQNSPVAYNPNAQEIIKLRELGISSEVITALIRRGDEVRKRSADMAKQTRSADPPPATNDPPSASVPSTVQPTVVYSAASPASVYTYPSYTYVPSYRYYPGYSCYPGGLYYGGYYGGYYPRLSFGVHFGGAYFRGHHGFHHCK